MIVDKDHVSAFRLTIGHAIVYISMPCSKIQVGIAVDTALW